MADLSSDETMWCEQANLDNAGLAYGNETLEELVAAIALIDEHMQEGDDSTTNTDEIMSRRNTISTLSDNGSDESAKSFSSRLTFMSKTLSKLFSKRDGAEVGSSKMSSLSADSWRSLMSDTSRLTWLATSYTFALARGSRNQAGLDDKHDVSAANRNESSQDTTSTPNRRALPPREIHLHGHPPRHPYNEQVIQEQPSAASIAPRFSPSKGERIYLRYGEITEQDICCGREYRGSIHPGNIEYRRIIGEHKAEYDNYGKQHKRKTLLSKSLVGTTIQGRFVKKDESASDGQFYLLTQDEARNKASQSLREK